MIWDDLDDRGKPVGSPLSALFGQYSVKVILPYISVFRPTLCNKIDLQDQCIALIVLNPLTKQLFPYPLLDQSYPISELS